ncbi:MAG: hypothetical protein AB7I50_21490 [Vicinamibacterales bacterium]
MTKHTPINWPHGRRFAFSVFDDPDSQTRANGEPVYRLLTELGLRTTKAVWPTRGTRQPSDHGETCAEPHYLAWARSLQDQGFEIALHNATLHTSTREETERGLELFREQFGNWPRSMANHYFAEEGIYFGDARVSGIRRVIYNVLTRGKNAGAFRGHIESDPLFWGDLCHERIAYVRNFVFRDINTLAACPLMPYRDSLRPYVRAWFAATEGSNADTFVRTLSAANVQQLEREGGACIVYTHFGHGHVVGGQVRRDVRAALTQLASRGGWFVPVSELLDYLSRETGPADLTDAQRSALEWRWLFHKVRFGTA